MIILSYQELSMRNLVAVLILPFSLTPLSACSPNPEPATALLRGIQGQGFEEGRVTLQSRMQERYPKGSSDAGLLSYLNSQGFAGHRDIVPGNEESPVRGTARLFRKRTGCDIVVGVDWRATAEGTITELDAIYSDVGCL
jgi:hypothetical protein